MGAGGRGLNSCGRGVLGIGVLCTAAVCALAGAKGNDILLLVRIDKLAVAGGGFYCLHRLLFLRVGDQSGQEFGGLAVVPEVHMVGDAVRARRALDATKEAYDVALKL